MGVSEMGVGEVALTQENGGESWGGGGRREVRSGGVERETGRKER